ncbi:hypothetical protein [Rhizobium sp. Leaf371]|uniref:hypothetical protein n=1 Tax=Rhizobium sp. Leaf371 TaxID=1736355 RepID=UPI000ACC7C69|nr:hypothetical protein [Rhizobium sp. Leaf371]
MNSNVVFLDVRETPVATTPKRASLHAFLSAVRKAIDRQKLVAARRATRRQLQALPTVVRRDVGLSDRPGIKNTELTHQFYSLD